MPRPCPILLLLAACPGHQPPPSTDAAFAGVQPRGAVVMGVSPGTSTQVPMVWPTANRETRAHGSTSAGRSRA